MVSCWSKCMLNVLFVEGNKLAGDDVEGWPDHSGIQRIGQPSMMADNG